MRSRRCPTDPTGHVRTQEAGAARLSPPAVARRRRHVAIALPLPRTADVARCAVPPGVRGGVAAAAPPPPAARSARAPPGRGASGAPAAGAAPARARGGRPPLSTACPQELRAV